MARQPIVSDFADAVLTKPKDKSFRAFIEMNDGSVGVTASYSKPVLDELVEELLQRGGKVLRIEETTGQV